MFNELRMEIVGLYPETFQANKDINHLNDDFLTTVVNNQ